MRTMGGGLLRTPGWLSLALALAGAAAPARAANPPSATALGSWSNGVSAPVRVAVGAGGRTYVSETEAGRVLVYDAFGRRAGEIAGLASPMGLAIGGDGRIYVGEGGRGRVSVFDAAWNPLGALGAGDGEFLLPGHIATAPGPDSTLAVSDGNANQIRVYTNGALAFAFGSPGKGNGQFDFPAGLVVTTNEFLVVDQRNNRVQVFDRAGGFLRAFLISADAASNSTGRCQGLALDPAGRLYAADLYNGYLRVFDTLGAALGAIGAYGIGPGQLASPTDVACDPFGRLLVASLGNARVELFGVDDYVHFIADPPAGVFAAGAGVTLSAVVGGAAGPVMFQWRRGTNEIPGATNAALVLAGLTPAEAGDYAVIVAGTSAVWDSGLTTLAVLNPPAIVTPPSAVRVARGLPAELTVAASGDALSYAWTRNGLPLAGATGSTLAIAAAAPADAGAYVVRVYNAVGEVVSDPVALQVVSPPGIVLDPTDVLAVEGRPADFHALASGEDLVYQWQFEGADIPGADQPDFVVPAVGIADAGAYRLAASNLAGAAVTAPAALSVLLAPRTNSMEAIAALDDGSVRVDMLAEPGFLFSLDVTADFTDWVRLATIDGATGVVTHIDAGTTNGLLRFYRLRWRY